MDQRVSDEETLITEGEFEVALEINVSEIENLLLEKLKDNLAHKLGYRPDEVPSQLRGKVDGFIQETIQHLDLLTNFLSSNNNITELRFNKVEGSDVQAVETLASLMYSYANIVNGSELGNSTHINVKSFTDMMRRLLVDKSLEV